MMGIFIKKVGKTINMPLCPFVDADFGWLLNNISWIKIIKIKMIINNTPQFVHIKTQDLNDRFLLAFYI